MRYIIYGVNRVTKDFLYLFEHLDILYLSDDFPAEDRIWGYEVKKLEDALQEHLYDKIIVCDFDKKQKNINLQEKGLRYGTDYIYEEDFFAELNDIVIPRDREILVWGTGNMSRFLLEQELDFSIKGFIDSYKTKDMFLDKPVFLPNEITDWKKYYVIVAVNEAKEIIDALSHYGLVKEEDYMPYQELLSLPSYMLRKTIFDRSYYELECNTMLNHLEIFGDGNTRCCCTTFVSQNLDNIFDKSRDELWHSALHKIMCLSTENRTFSFCDKSMCPLFVAKKNKVCKSDEIREREYQKISKFPETLSLGHDSSCNLSCITCRKDVHFAKDEELLMVNRVTEEVIKNYLSHTKFLILAGNGEVFASPAYKNIYEASECNPEYIRILSNGTLFTSDNWKKFSEGKTAKMMLTVSVDAATEETYRRIRRGDFVKLKRNMEFASELRKKGELCYFRMNFVVQKENYKEMIPFVEWGEELGVDEVFFTKILNWGTYTPEEFAEVSMMELDGVTPKPELKEICDHPVMHSDIVDMGTIQFAHKIDEIGVVENYYMWELEKRGGKLFQKEKISEA